MSWFLPLLSSLIVVFLCCPVSFLDGAPDPVETRRRRRTICQGKHPVVTFQGLSYPLFSCLSYVVLLFLCSAEAMPVGVCQSSCSRSCSSLPFVPIVRQQSAVSSSGSDPSFVSGCGRGLCRGPLLLAKKVIWMLIYCSSFVLSCWWLSVCICAGSHFHIFIPCRLLLIDGSENFFGAIVLAGTKVCFLFCQYVLSVVNLFWTRMEVVLRSFFGSTAPSSSFPKAAHRFIKRYKNSYFYYSSFIFVQCYGGRFILWWS